MELGIVGLGRMGMSLGARLVRDGHSVLGNDLLKDKEDAAEKNGIGWRDSIEELVSSLASPKAVWIMAPAGQPVDDALSHIVPGLSPGDVVIDGGNSYYKDSVRRAKDLEGKKIHFLDCGTSGGVWGLEEGFCLMVGGPQEAYSRIEPIFKSLAAEGGYKHVGPVGAGHFVKMVHNGVEYGILQAYGEGFSILHASHYELDYKEIANLWNHGSVIRSWLLELAERAFDNDPNLDSIAGYVEDTGEGRWTVFQSIDEDVPAPVIALSLLARLQSRDKEVFTAKVIAALRREFGGHRVFKE